MNSYQFWQVGTAVFAEAAVIHNRFSLGFTFTILAKNLPTIFTDERY
jgi:hypothetical protein